MKKIIIICLLLSVFSISFLFFLHRDNSIEFSPEQWAADIWKREKMLEDLIQTHHLEQMNDDQIIDLLGTNGIVEGSHITYYIGKTFSGPVLFNISFDKKGYVSTYGVIVD